MATNLGLAEEFDFEIKLTDDQFAPKDQERLKRYALSKRKFDKFMQSQPGEELNQVQTSSEEALSPSFEAERFPVLDKTNRIFSSRISSVDLNTSKQTAKEVATALEVGENSLSSPTDVPSANQNSQSGFSLDTSSGWVGDRSSDSPTQPAQFVCNCPDCCDSGAPQFQHIVSDANQSAASSSDIINNVAKSGDIKIDSLIRNYKWRDTTITYSFFDGGSYYGKEKNVKEITGTMKSYLRNILENVLEPLINVDFVEVSDKGNNYGQIRYMFSDNPSSAYTKSLSNGSPLAGDIHFNPAKTKYFEQGPGAYRYETLIHETLHALGLKHPGNYNGSSNGGQDGPFLSNKLDNSANSILSYNRLSDKSPFTGAITPMTHDIKALQYLYGAKEHEVGDTIYKFDTVYGYTIGGDFFGSKTQGVKQTIWDSNGYDTFDFSGLAFKKSGYRFDLQEGGWITTQSAYESTSYKARGNGKTYQTTALGTKTAFGATIEKLVASTSDDTIIANKDAANIFSGYDANTNTGNDTIINSTGLDKLDLSGYKSADVTQTTSGKNLILGLGGNGSVTIQDYFAVSQPDRIQILFDGTTPPTPPSGSKNPVTGTGGDDLLKGTTGDDLIKGLGGNDTLRGYAGADELRGGNGADHLKGGKGADLLEGWHGDDTLEGGNGDDTLNGGLGDDILIGGKGDDLLKGGSGKDTFVYETVDQQTDTISDFQIGSDKIDLSSIFKGSKYASPTAFNDYVQLEQLGSDTSVKVDVLGDIGGDQFRAMATLTNVDKTKLTAEHFVLA